MYPSSKTFSSLVFLLVYCAFVTEGQGPVTTTTPTSPTPTDPGATGSTGTSESKTPDVTEAETSSSSPGPGPHFNAPSDAPDQTLAAIENGGECDNQRGDVFNGCKPCSLEKWHKMVSAKDSGLPAVAPNGPQKCQDLIFFSKEDSCEVTDQADCFNQDPLSVSSAGEAILISSSQPSLDPYKSSLGFSIPEFPFFRYFLPPDARAAKNYKKFDIGQVSQYFVSDGTAGGQKFDTDFELLEWPGNTASQHVEYLEDSTKDTYGCVDNSLNPITNKCTKKHGFVMLAYDRDNTKFINYPCNAVKGTSIVAYGNVRSLPSNEADELKKPNGEPTQKVWLSRSTYSIHEQYVQPLFIRRTNLDEMISQDDPTICQDVQDLRTVMDFTFTTERLLLGMKCGIIIVSKIFDSDFIFYVAQLRKPTGLTTAFDHPINKISASVCCRNTLDCAGNRHIVAAYSFDALRKPEDLKYLYISFDLGDTFEIKYVAPPSTQINLIKSIYGAYERWHLYYQFMTENWNDDLFEDVRKFDEWKYLNVEEKEEFIINHSSSVNASASLQEGLQKIHEVFCKKVNEMLKELPPNDASTDMTPEWVTRSINNRYREFGVENETECDKNPTCSENFQNDLVVEEIMKDYYKNYDCPENMDEWKKKTVVKTRKQKPNETYCLEITSVVVNLEEQNLLVLCKVGFCDASGSGQPDCSKVPDDSNLYAVFDISVKPGVPISYPRRLSKRIFECKLMEYKTMAGHEKMKVQPEIIRVPGSAAIFIVNCANVIYFSGNTGRTIFNTGFYTRDETDPALVKFYRNFVMDELDVPPCVAIDSNGKSIIMTFRNFYAYGVINFRRETRLLVGRTFVQPRDGMTAMSNLNEAEVVAIPWFTNSGEITVSLALLGIIGREPEYKDFYHHRHAIKLVEIPLSFYKDIVPFYSENLNVNEQASANHLDFTDCETYAFVYSPKRARLDIGDSVVISVKVTDVNRFLPIGIYTNEEKSLLLNVKATNKSLGDPDDAIKHDWDITITALPHYRDKEEALIDSFFGAEYNDLYEYSSNVVLINLPSLRCHVQPSGTVETEIGCLGKTLEAHEDEHRPQCKNTFIKNEKYTIERGMYNPEMARYWIENNPDFVKRRENGDLEITYDFSTFGCPIQPYIGDPFFPDLRILTEDIKRNTSLANNFDGNYVLIEIFGAKGFTYLYNVGDAGCNRRPQNSSAMIQDWISRRRIFNISAGRLVDFAGEKRSGNLLFDGKHANEHINIWNRVNYESCISENGNESLTDDEKLQPYEIMNNQFFTNCSQCTNDSTNSIMWDPNKRPTVFIFLAVAVDNTGTLCNFHTIFGVSLPKANELEDLLSFVVFVFFVLLWIMLVLLGYFCRKSYLRKAYIYEARSERLKQAAWTVIYRYEKLLHENENKELETEITEFTQALNQKDREKAYEKMQQKQPKPNKQETDQGIDRPAQPTKK